MVSGLPNNQSVARGQSANYAVTVTGTNGFVGSITLTTGTLPSDVSAKWSVSSVSLSTSTKSGTSTLTLTASPTMKAGSYDVAVIGSAGTGKTRSGTVGFNVSAGNSGSFVLNATPPSLDLVPGSSGTTAIGIARSNFSGSVALAISGLPQGATATFSPNPASGTSSNLVLQMGNSTPTGTSTVTVSGTSTGNSSSITIQLAVQQAQPLAISGTVISPLAPGVAAQPIDLALRNPNPNVVSVTALGVTVSGTSAGSACDASNFAVTQYRGTYPLTLAAGQTLSLSQLGVPAAQQPQVQFLNKPVNQDRCKGVTVYLSYSGSAGGN
jgi:hypothetical protein